MGGGEEARGGVAWWLPTPKYPGDGLDESLLISLALVGPIEKEKEKEMRGWGGCVFCHVRCLVMYSTHMREGGGGVGQSLE